MTDDTRTLLLAELDTSLSPYYFMSSLATLAEEGGDASEAIEWRLKAYESSVGTATRFQWGASYARALLRLAPERRDNILELSQALLAELPEGAFVGRNFRVLVRLNTALMAWDQDVQIFTDRVRQRCATEEPDSRSYLNCQTLFEPSE